MIRRGPLAAAALLLVACASAPGAADPPPTPLSTPSTSSMGEPLAPDAGAAPVESEAERRARVAEARRLHCQELATAMASRGQDVLLNVHDGASLIAVGGELDESADQAERVQISAEELTPLAELRSAYTTTSRAMAKALFATADAAGFEQRKAPLAEFRELEPKLRKVLAELTEYCSA